MGDFVVVIPQFFLVDMKTTIIDAVADLHGYIPNLEGGDLLIIAGDITARNEFESWIDFGDWLREIIYTKNLYKECIIVAGNHDGNIHVLIDHLRHSKRIHFVSDSLIEINGLKIWGSPWSVWFDRVNPECSAYMAHDLELAEKYKPIPEGIDILISHGPPLHVLDQNRDGYHCGSKSLVEALDRVKPRVLICGHIHEQGTGEFVYRHGEIDTWCMNCSYVNEHYEPDNRVMRIELKEAPLRAS